MEAEVALEIIFTFMTAVSKVLLGSGQVEDLGKWPGLMWAQSRIEGSLWAHAGPGGILGYHLDGRTRSVILTCVKKVTTTDAPCFFPFSGSTMKKRGKLNRLDLSTML